MDLTYRSIEIPVSVFFEEHVVNDGFFVLRSKIVFGIVSAVHRKVQWKLTLYNKLHNFPESLVQKVWAASSFFIATINVLVNSSFHLPQSKQWLLELTATINWERQQQRVIVLRQWQPRVTVFSNL
ncbi:hypothetical protein RJT34_17685 [Clitoria ternatea]|uniref:Uncharacterized protein n=1 Tax=Clitoria ternatea TaxID=43366 RepID=A0AAN9JCI1_CLITE